MTRYALLLVAAGAVSASAMRPNAPAPNAPPPNAPAPNAAWHLHLVKSDPKANDTLYTAPTAVRLWFTEAPEMAVTSVKMVSASGTPVAMKPVTRDTAASAPVVAAISGPVPPGSYVVNWKTTADDGHPAAGSIPFVVAR